MSLKRKGPSRGTVEVLGQFFFKTRGHIKRGKENLKQGILAPLCQRGQGPGLEIRDQKGEEGGSILGRN